jgi:hypothetical protein
MSRLCWRNCNSDRESAGGSSGAETSGAEIKASQMGGEVGDCEMLFRAVLSNLEQVLFTDERLTRSALYEGEHAWKHTYLSRPHGQPVKLR